jgi:ABC-type glycerol-3-phosphate transport system substrate-binding protein
VDWLAQGKFALGLFLGEVDKAAAQGLPVDEFDPHNFKEGAPLGVGIGTITLISNGPHPSAARLFVNWFLSREGQAAIQKEMVLSGSGADSMRVDISKDEVSPTYRRREGAKYLFVARSEFNDMRPIYKVINEALSAAGKQ